MSIVNILVFARKCSTLKEYSVLWRISCKLSKTSFTRVRTVYKSSHSHILGVIANVSKHHNQCRYIACQLPHSNHSQELSCEVVYMLWIIESPNHFSWKRPLGSSSPTVNFEKYVIPNFLIFFKSERMQVDKFHWAADTFSVHSLSYLAVIYSCSHTPVLSGGNEFKTHTD